MKLPFLKMAIVACAFGVGNQLSAQNGLSDPMTKAMMDIYEQELVANPKAYDIYFRRANEYYKFDQYLRALSDIDNAIKYIPANDNEMQFECYSLRGQIYQMLGKHEEALQDFETALKLDPTSFMMLYQKANEEYELGRYADAKASYSRMRANNGRSAEALTGLARVAVKENNLGLAQQYMDDAVAMMPSDSDIYVRRASVRRMLGNNTGAVEDLIMAISTDSNPRAFQELINISYTDYPAVITALSSAVSQAPDQGMFYYIRGVIAQAHNHFPTAIADYRRIVDENLYNYAGIYASLGECYYALCDYDRALENVNQAIGMTGDNGEYFIALAKIYRAQERYEDATRAINNAAEKLGFTPEVQAENGRILYSNGKFDDASTVFGELIMDNPNDPMNYMLRGWVIYDGLQESGNAMSIYRRMFDIDMDPDLPQSLNGFAQLFTGKKTDALKWAETIAHSASNSDGSASYLAACLYAQAEEPDAAFDALEAALNKGYSNLYEIKVNRDARINLEPIRSDTRFDTLLHNYSYIFE